MSRYIVFEPKTASVGLASEGARFVRDDVARWAVILPFLWLMRHGLWLSGVSCLLIWAGFGLLADVAGLRWTAAVLPILLGCLVALEGPSLLSWKLRRKGFEERAVVEAEDEEDASILYFAGDASPVTRETPHLPPFVGRSAGRAASLLDPPGR